MAKAEYKVVSGQADKIGAEIAAAGRDGWKPILMTSTLAAGNLIIITVILEHTLG